MNSKKVALILFILLAAIIFLVSSKKAPVSKSPLPLPSASTYNPPKQIQYDSSTDLKKELDSVNPQVLDIDFQ